jgi:hypothetical protein
MDSKEGLSTPQGPGFFSSAAAKSCPDLATVLHNMEKQFRLGECFPRELTKRGTLEHAPRARAHKKCR